MQEKRIFRLKTDVSSPEWGTFPAGSTVTVALFDPETFKRGYAQPFGHAFRIPANDPFITTILANSERVPAQGDK